MDVFMLGTGTFFIYVDPSELDRRHIRPCEATLEDAESIIKGFAGGDSSHLQLDMFTGQNELIIFVQENPETPLLFAFSDIESLIGAAALPCTDVPSALYYYDSQYIAALWCRDPEIAAALSEFGAELDSPCGYFEHVKEHGRCICPYEAFSLIKSAFLRR